VHGNQDADSGLLAVNNMRQVANGSGPGVPRLDRIDDLLRLRGIAFVKEETTIDPLVCPLLLIDGPRMNKPKRPPLELILVPVG
jgi:hypothetical protein